MEILKFISKQGGIHLNYLKDNLDFIRLLIRCLYKKEKEIVQTSNIIIIIKNLLDYENLKVEVFLIGTGLIYFILN